MSAEKDTVFIQTSPVTGCSADLFIVIQRHDSNVSLGHPDVERQTQLLLLHSHGLQQVTAVTGCCAVSHQWTDTTNRETCKDSIKDSINCQIFSYMITFLRTIVQNYDFIFSDVGIFSSNGNKLNIHSLAT